MRRIGILLPALAALALSAMPAAADQIENGDVVLHRYEWRASTFAISAQHEAALAVDGDGNVVSVWSSRRQQTGRSGVYAQRFDAQGVALGSETQLGLQPVAHQVEPAVCVDARGHIWAAWQSHGQDGWAGSIIARRFDDALRGGSEIAVNQRVRGHQSSPAIAALANGNVVVVWMSAEPHQPMQTRGRLFGPDGKPVTDEFALTTAEAHASMTPAVCPVPSGGFAVAYSVFTADMKPAGIRMQRYGALGQRIGAAIDVCGAQKVSQVEPAIAATRDGFVVAWLDAESDGDDYGVLARRFDAEGRALGDAFVVNTHGKGLQNAAAVAVGPDGRFAVAWNSAAKETAGVYAQCFDADGQRVGDVFRLTRSTEGKQMLRPAAGTQRLVYRADGALVCAWNGDANCGDKSSANVTLLAARPVGLAGRSQGVTSDMQPAAVRTAFAAGPQPHIPPTFARKDIDEAEREIRLDGRFGFTAVTATGWTPPDPHMAVGPEHIVVMTNGEISFFTKDGTQTFEDEIEDSFGFWGSEGATGFVFDPEVLYDETSGRFFAMAAEAYAPGNNSYVLVAVSDDSDPNGTWYKYRLSTTGFAGDLFDSPNIAVSDDTVLITGDGFGNGANYPVYTYDKASLLAGQTPQITNSFVLSTSTQSAGIPPAYYDSPPALYMLEHAEGVNRNTVRLIGLQDPLGTPTYETYTLSVPAYSSPGDPPQQGTSNRPETFDARFWSVAYRNGSLWGTHHVNSNPVEVRWYEIAMNGWPDSGENPELVQTGTLNPSSSVNLFFSAITVNNQGDAAITCARSGYSEYISMVTTYRLATDPINTFNDLVTEQASTGPYSAYGRWGDYAAVNVDPADNGKIWAHHEYAINNSWRTWVARIDLPASALGDMNCDGAVNFDDIAPFVLALSGQAGYEAQYPDCQWLNGDCDFNGQVDFDDISCFVELIGG